MSTISKIPTTSEKTQDFRGSPSVTTPSTTKKHFLDLPQAARYRVYYLVGLHRTCPIVLSGRSASPKYLRGSLSAKYCAFKQAIPTYRHPRAPSCYCMSIPTGMFTICRSLHAEISTYFYSINKFEILAPNVVNLDVLRHLSRAALSSMTSLTIQLQPWPCCCAYDSLYPTGYGCNECGHMKDPFHDTSYGVSSVRLQMIASWRKICRYLSRRIVPSQLNFTLTWNSADLLSAQKVCKSLEYLPQLRNCTIRLSPFPDDDLSALARLTVQRRIGAQSPSDTRLFDFFRLPAEIRRQILEHTHLNPATSNPHDASHHIDVLRKKGDRVTPKHVLARWCCGTCTETRGSCCCPRSKSAFSLTCSCRSLPYSLFLVSKQMKEEAEIVLFNLNCLNFRLDLRRADRQRAVNFLHGLGANNLWAIRHMHFKFSYGQLTRSGTRIRRMQWHPIVRQIKDNCNIGKLCLVMDFIDDLDGHGNTDTWTRLETWEAMLTYRLICEFVIELMVFRYKIQDLHLNLPSFRFLEALLERQVVGQQYDSYFSRGRPKAMFQSGRYSRLPPWHANEWKIFEDMVDETSREIGTD